MWASIKVLAMFSFIILVINAALAGERECIKNEKGARIGCTIDYGSYIDQYDERGKRLGRYYKGSDRTTTPTGESIGCGNQLQRLLLPLEKE